MTRRMKTIICLLAAMLMAVSATACAPAQSTTETAVATDTSATAATAEPVALTALPADKLNYVIAAAAGGGLDIVSRCFSD